MTKRRVTFTYDGDTFVGSYVTTSYAGIKSVAVQLEGRTQSARVGELDDVRVARSLLGQLVRERFASTAANPASSRSH